MKKCNLFCIIIILIISMFHSVYATEGTNIASGKLTDYVSWELTSDGELRLYGSNIIPQYEFDEYPWDIYGDSIKSVTIESGITQIPDDLFSQKPNITQINIGDTVDNIGSSVFFNCTSLQKIDVSINNATYCSIDGVLYTREIDTLLWYPSGKTDVNYTLPTSVTTISSNSLTHNNFLEELIITDNCNVIEDSAIYGCNKIKSITLGASIDNIDGILFTASPSIETILVSEDNSTYSSYEGTLFSKDKSQLLRYPPNKQGSYIIPDGVNMVGKSAFHSSTGITSLDTGNTTKTISTFGFHSCPNLKSVVLRKSMVTLERMSFYNCDSLNSIVIEEGLLSIGHTAFESCSSLKEITIPASVLDVSNYAFYNSTNLENIYVNDKNENFCDLDGVLYTKDKATLVCFPAGKKEEEYQLNDDTLSISNGAFAFNDYIKQVILPSNLNHLGKHSFNDCSSLTQINFPNELNSIGSYAFYHCEKLEDISFGKNIKIIDYCAFGSCTSLKTLQWDNAECYVYTYAFLDCPNLEDVYITNLNNWINTTFEDFYSNPLCNEANLYVNNEVVTVLDLNDYPYSIPNYCFTGCKSLNKIVATSENKEIGINAFSHCQNLTSAYFEEGLVALNEYVFSNCKALTYVKIPFSTEYIGDYCFWSCPSLRCIDYYGNEDSWDALITSKYTIPYGTEVNYLLCIKATWINGIVKIDCSQSIKDKTLIVASYQNEVFDNIHSIIVENDELSQIIDFIAPTGSNLKVFVWESLSSCKPSCSALYINEQTIMTDEEIKQAEFLEIYAVQGLLAAINSGLYESENTQYFLRYPKYAVIVDEEYPIAKTIDELEKILLAVIDETATKQGATGTNGGVYS